MNRNDHGMVYIILATEDRRTKKIVGMYQADLSPWTRLKSYKLPLLVALAMRLLLYTNDIRISKTQANEAHIH